MAERTPLGSFHGRPGPRAQRRWLRSWRSGLTAAGVALVAAPLAAAQAAPPPEPVITTLAEAHRRWPGIEREEPPVRVEGVVTGTMPSGAFRLHDGERGIYVTGAPVSQHLRPRDRVLVSGVVRKGGYSPWIMPHEVVRLGVGNYPHAARVAYDVLAAGTADNQWVEIEGIVRAAELLQPPNFVELDVGMAGGNLRVLVNHAAGQTLPTLLDARVRIRGVAAVSVNRHGHVVEPTFRVPSFAEIEVVAPPPSDVFTRPLVTIDRLMRSTATTDPGSRVRTRGEVTRRVSPSLFFVSDGQLGLKVETAHPVDYQPGTVVELAGFPVMADGLAVLEHSLGRIVRLGQPPTPARPSIQSLLDGNHSSDLVSIRARLVDWSATGPTITLIFEAGEHLFKGVLTLAEEEAPALPARDSVVDVTGICMVSELEDVWYYKPSTFLMLLASLDDLAVVQAPPWWTPDRLWRALGIACLVLLAVTGWVWALRRQVGRERAVVEQQARHAAALEERNRIARELHDTLEQGLTGLSLQMKAMETELDGSPHPVLARLQFARQMLRQSRALARDAIRELRTEAVPSRLDGLVNGLKRVADSWNHSGALNVDVRVTGEPRTLRPQLGHHLLGIATEAVTNAVKHGRAEIIQIEASFGPSSVAVRIIDNGAGFDPAHQLQQTSGCFGLVGMHERVRELNGDIQIRSTPGRGAEIVVSAPYETHDRAPAPVRLRSTSVA